MKTLNTLSQSKTGTRIGANCPISSPSRSKSTALRILFLLAAAPFAGADAVLDWNAISARTIFAGGRPGPSSFIDFAVVQATVHDAVQAYNKTFASYAVEISGATGSPSAAVAKASRDILVNRFPAQAAAVDAAYASYFAAHGLAATDAGVSVGAAAADAMITLRTGDGAFPNPAPVFNGANVVGAWRPTPSLLPGGPPTFASMAAPWLAETTPFVALSNDQFAGQPPAELNTGRYTGDYNEVKELGALVNSQRTPEQTQNAYFWADNFPAQINRALRNLAETQLENSGDRARLLALAWLSAADGLINTWFSKLEYPTWRPITAIREGDADGNPHTIGDPNWQPLINTPNYPEHCSGANGFVGGTMQMLKLFFGTDEVTFSVTSANPNANPNTRTYTRFSDAALDVVEARICQGIHLRTADREGRQLGQNVARWVFKHALRPL